MFLSLAKIRNSKGWSHVHTIQGVTESQSTVLKGQNSSTPVSHISSVGVRHHYALTVFMFHRGTKQESKNVTAEEEEEDGEEEEEEEECISVAMFD